MKKIFLALMMMIGVVTAAQAQTELSVSYGAYTQMDAMDCHDGPSYTFSSSTRKHYDEDKF